MRVRGLRKISLLLLLASGLTPTARAQMLGPSRTDTLLARGEIALARAQVFEAECAFRDAVTSNPRDPRGYLALVTLYLHLRELGRALEAVHAAQRIAPGRTAVIVAHARVLTALSRATEAQELLLAGLAHAPDATDILRELSVLAEARGAFVASLAWLRRLRHSLPAAATERAELDRRERAIAYFLGEAERVRPARRACGQTGETLRDALAHCPLSP